MDSTTVLRPTIKEPIVIFEQEVVNKHFEIVNTFIGVPSGTSNTFSPQGEIINMTPYSTSTQLINDTITYFNTPYEIIKDVEIARYITPYGIQFDLGPNGFAWIYDVTDYQDYLRNTVDLAAHNTQELLDLRFAFIEGIPPRDLHKREPIWSDFRNYNFANMANDVVLPATNVVLSDTSEMFKIKTRMSGHGQVGDYACCEWVNNNHQINVNGVPRFQWNIWQDTECGENPNIGQGLFGGIIVVGIASDMQPLGKARQHRNQCGCGERRIKIGVGPTFALPTTYRCCNTGDVLLA
jgi:hypothetical protein